MNQNRTLRSLFSVLIFAHLCFVAISISRNQVSSELFRRISRSVGIYTRSAGLDAAIDLDFRLTHAASFEDNHHFEVFRSDEPLRLPDAIGTRTGEKGGFRYNRFRQFTRQAAIAASIEDDSTLALYARCIGNHFLSLDEPNRLIIRLVAYQPRDWQGLPNIIWSDLKSPINYETVYEADVWRGDNGRVQVHKRVPAAEAAPLSNGVSR